MPFTSGFRRYKLLIRILPCLSWLLVHAYFGGAGSIRELKPSTTPGQDRRRRRPSMRSPSSACSVFRNRVRVGG